MPGERHWYNWNFLEDRKRNKNTVKNTSKRMDPGHVQMFSIGYFVQIWIFDTHWSADRVPNRPAPRIARVVDSISPGGHCVYTKEQHNVPISEITWIPLMYYPPPQRFGHDSAAEWGGVGLGGRWPVKTERFPIICDNWLFNSHPWLLVMLTVCYIGVITAIQCGTTVWISFNIGCLSVGL